MMLQFIVFFSPQRVLICLDVTAVLQLQAEYSLSFFSVNSNIFRSFLYCLVWLFYFFQLLFYVINLCMQSVCALPASFLILICSVWCFTCAVTTTATFSLFLFLIQKLRLQNSSATNAWNACYSLGTTPSEGGPGSVHRQIILLHLQSNRLSYTNCKMQ